MVLEFDAAKNQMILKHGERETVFTKGKISIFLFAFSTDDQSWITGVMSFRTAAATTGFFMLTLMLSTIVPYCLSARGAWPTPLPGAFPHAPID
jgi:hypothetical protein